MIIHAFLLNATQTWARCGIFVDVRPVAFYAEHVQRNFNMANKNQNTKQNDNFNSSFTIFLALIALATMLRLAKMHGIVKSDDASVPKTAQPAPKNMARPDSVFNNVAQFAFMDSLRQVQR